MLGAGSDDKDKFLALVKNFYRQEAQAGETLTKMADQIRATGEEGSAEIADEILETIPEEIMHAKRLEKAFEAHGIQFDKIEC